MSFPRKRESIAYPLVNARSRSSGIIMVNITNGYRVDYRIKELIEREMDYP